MQTNTSVKKSMVKTFEGGGGKILSSKDELLKTMATCLLFEKTFYEGGASIANRIRVLAHKVEPEYVAAVAKYVKNVMKLRHSPMYLALQLLDHPKKNPYGEIVINDVVNRADELAEMLAMYWKNGKKPLAAQLKKGLAEAFTKFDEYQLAKWDDQEKEIKLKDVMFMVHPKPKDKEQEKLWTRLVDGKMKTPWTWEVELSAGKDKKSVWEKLLVAKKLPYFALLKNLRNMSQAGVSGGLVNEGIVNGFGKAKILPFQFMTAARYAPEYTAALDQALVKSLEGLSLPGKTIVLVDVSGSMDYPLSSKGVTSRLDPACALAALMREVCEECRVFSFSGELKEVPAYRGLALAEGIKNSQSHGGTYLAGALSCLVPKVKGYDRIVVITDEQSADTPRNPPTERGYVINVASYQPALKLNEKWARIDGWSERVIDWICFEEFGKMMADWGEE